MESKSRGAKKGENKLIAVAAQAKQFKPGFQFKAVLRSPWNLIYVLIKHGSRWFN